VKQATELAGAVESANETIRNLDHLDQLMNAPGVPSGRFANWELEGKRIAGALFPNANMQGVKEAEAANAIANNLTLMARNAGSGAGMPGAMSDADRVFLTQMVPNLAQTAAGRNLLIRVMRETSRYRSAVAQEAMSYIETHHTNEGLTSYMTQWMKDHPMEAVIPEHAQTREQANIIAPPKPVDQAARAPAAPPAGGSSEPPQQAAIDRLKAARGTPQEAKYRADFDKIFGRGAAAMYLDGIDPGSGMPVQGEQFQGAP
jgi:hypothetical protein